MCSSPSRIAFLLLGCLGQFAADASAQSPPNPTPTIPVFETEVLVTAERGAVPRDDTAAATAVLKRADIEMIPGFTLPALMTFLPGFHVLFGSDFAGTPMVQSRGFFGGGEAEYVQLLIDGVPAGDAEAGLADWRRVRSWDIERIEARRGPSSSLYGDTALGGVIHVISRKDVPRGGLAVSGGSFGTASIDGGISRAVGATVATLTAMASRGNGFRTHSAVREGAFSAALERGSPAHRLSVRGGVERRNQDEPGPRSAAQLSADRFGSSPMFHGDNESTSRGRASVDYGFAGPAMLINALVYGNTRDSDRTRTLLLAPGLGLPADRELSTKTAGGSLRVERHNRFLGGDTATRAGIETAYDSVNSGYLPATTDDTNVNVDGTRRRVGIYISESWIATPRLRLSGGVRYDRIIDHFAGTTNGSPNHEAWSPRFGLAYRLMDGDRNATTVFLEAVRAFKAPTLDQLFDPRPFPDLAGGTFVISNPRLEPQRALNLETGVRHTIGASRVEVIAYRMRVEDEIDFDPMTFTYGNIGNTYHSGIEAEVHWRTNARVMPSLRYAWTVVAPVDGLAGRQLKNIPRHLWKPTVALRLPRNISATIAYTRTAGRFLDDDNVFPLNDTSSIDVRVMKIFRRLNASIDLLNLTNDEFEEVGFALPGFEGVAEPFYFPGPGFGARAGVELRF